MENERHYHNRIIAQLSTIMKLCEANELNKTKNSQLKSPIRGMGESERASKKLFKFLSLRMIERTEKKSKSRSESVSVFVYFVGAVFPWEKDQIFIEFLNDTYFSILKWPLLCSTPLCWHCCVYWIFWSQLRYARSRILRNDHFMNRHYIHFNFPKLIDKCSNKCGTEVK